MGLRSALLAMGACDNQRIVELEEGVSSEADVRARFGEPEKIWDAANGGRTLEYNRQPAGYQNYMITIGTDGKMSALRQVLSKEKFRQSAARRNDGGRPQNAGQAHESHAL